MNTFTSGLTYKHKKLWTLIVHWVTGCHQLMAIVGDSEFLNLVKMLNPRVVLPSWNTIVADDFGYVMPGQRQRKD